MIAVLLILALIAACLIAILCLMPRLEDDGDFYIDDGIDHCIDCDVRYIEGAEACRECVYNRTRKKSR